MRIGALLKTIVVILGGLVAAVVVVLLTVDFGTYKSEITAALTEVSGREVSVDGDFKLRFGIRPSVTATGVKIANAPWGTRPYMMTAQRFAAEIALLPLAEGRVVVKRLIFIKPELFIETDRKGRSNWAVDLAEDSDETAIPDIGTVVIRNGRATVLDSRTKDRRTVEISRLRLAPTGPYGSFRFDVAGALDGRRMKARGTLGVPNKKADRESPWLLEFVAEAGGATVNVIGTVKAPAVAKGVDIDVEVDLRSRGATMPELAAGLNGSLSAVMGPGELRNEYFDMLSTDVIESISPWASPRRTARINCAVARFEIRNGIAVSRATVIDSQRATVVGEGAIDLGRERIGFTVSPNVKDAGLVSLTVPIRISGALDDPSIDLDSGKLAQDTVGAVADLAESIGSIVGIGDSSDRLRNPCVAALAAPARPHPASRTKRRPEP